MRFLVHSAICPGWQWERPYPWIIEQLAMEAMAHLYHL